MREREREREIERDRERGEKGWKIQKISICVEDSSSVCLEERDPQYSKDSSCLGPPSITADAAQVT